MSCEEIARLFRGGRPRERTTILPHGETIYENFETGETSVYLPKETHGLPIKNEQCACGMMFVSVREEKRCSKCRRRS